MSTDSKEIVNEMTETEVLDLLSATLAEKIPPDLYEDLDAFVAALSKVPPALAAMAATHQLDVSLTMDPLGWHFSNWHHHGYARATARGLRELGALHAAELFESAYLIAQRHWKELESDDPSWYEGSELERELAPIDRELSELVKSYGEFGIMSLWVTYARQHPRLLCE